MMQKLASGALVLVCALTFGASTAAAAPITVIGLFSWEVGDPEFGLGPTFSFEYLSVGLLENLSVDLDTDLGSASFAFNTTVGFDNDGDGVEEAFRSQITNDLSAFTIFSAFIRAQGAVLFLLDPNASEARPLLDSNLAPLGLDGVSLLSAQVGIEVPETPPPPPPPAPVPEPATVLLVGIGLAGALVRARRVRPRR